MRGTPLKDNISIVLPGITPAHAGNTCFLLYLGSVFTDHPRACGEHIIRKFILPFYLGSPPRMRGTQISPVFNLKIFGITPAHAGNTLYRALYL